MSRTEYLQDMRELLDRNYNLLHNFADQRWLPLVVLFSVGYQSFRLLLWISQGYPPGINRTAALFQYGGWYITKGAIPYVHFLEVKPPLAFGVPAALAFVTGGDMVKLHLASIIISSLSLIGVSVVIGIIIHKLTSDGLASIAGSLVIFTVPVISAAATRGFRPFYPAMLFGLLGIWMVIEERPMSAGVLAAISGGFWQFTIIFPILTLYIGWNKSKKSVKHILLGAGITTIIVLLPFILIGHLDSVIEAVILNPTVTHPEKTGQASSLPIITRPLHSVGIFGFSTLLIFIGAIGLWKRRDEVWPIAGGLWALLQIYFLVMENWTDLQIGLIFVSLGVGLFTATRKKKIRSIFPVIVVLIILINILWISGTFAGLVGADSSESVLTRDGFRSTLGLDGSNQPVQDNPNETRSELDIRQDIYWNKILPENCHSENFIYKQVLPSEEYCYQLP